MAMNPQSACESRFPLPAGRLLETRSLDELGHAVSRRTVERRFALTSPRHDACFRLTGLRLQQCQVFGCSHSVPLLCESTPLDCFEIYCVGKGLLISQPEGQRHCVHSGMGIVHLPGERVLNSWASGFQALVFRVPAEDCRDYFGARQAAHVDRPRFRRSRVFSLDQSLGQSLVTLTAQLCRAQASDGPDDSDSAALERLLIHNLALIVSQRLGLESRGDCQGSSHHLERAMDYLFSHLDENITLESLSVHAGVSGRMLQYLFADRFGVGPVSYIKHEKLKRARRDLLRASPGSTSVTEVACRWGFTNLSHFSRSYRAMFGEAPSATLRRIIPVGAPGGTPGAG